MYFLKESRDRDFLKNLRKCIRVEFRTSPHVLYQSRYQALPFSWLVLVCPTFQKKKPIMSFTLPSIVKQYQAISEMTYVGGYSPNFRMGCVAGTPKT